MRRLLIAAVVGAAPAAAAGQTPAAPAPAAQAPLPAAVALAELVTPLDLYVEAEVAGGRAGFMGVAEANPDLKALEADYPGIVAFTFGEILPLLRQHATKQRSQHVARLARLYHAMLTPAEIATMDTYYRTETGRRTIRTMFTAGDNSAVVKEVAANPDGQVSAAALASVSESAQRKLAAETGPADGPAIRAMMQGISLAKLNLLGQAVEKLTHELVNERDPASDAALDEATAKAFDTFIARQEAKR